MGLLTRFDKWTFNGTDFAVEAGGNSWEIWFEEETQTKVDPIIDSSSMYVDTGGTTYSPLVRKAYFETYAAQQAFKAFRGVDATLEGLQGQTATALLQKTKQLTFEGKLWVLECTFIRIS